MLNYQRVCTLSSEVRGIEAKLHPGLRTDSAANRSLGQGLGRDHLHRNHLPQIMGAIWEPYGSHM